MQLTIRWSFSEFGIKCIRIFPAENFYCKKHKRYKKTIDSIALARYFIERMQ